MLPLYEAKMLHIYDTRWATYEPDGSVRLMTEAEKAERKPPMPRYWVAETDVNKKLDGKWDKQWILGWRDICRATDARTMIATVGPKAGYGHKWLVSLHQGAPALLQSAWSSLVVDFVARQKIGGTSMSYFVMRQLPILHPSQFEGTLFDRSLESWISLRVDRLNAWIPNIEEWAQVRAELDALFFHLYGLNRHDVDYVLDSFSIIARKERTSFGTYRTKEMILRAYDAMSHARATSSVYQPPWKEPRQ